MIKLENYEVMGWEHAIRGMRNPLNSWDKSDSADCPDRSNCRDCPFNNHEGHCLKPFEVTHIVGPNDHDLMTRLRNAGTDHRKFMRMITVYVDITAPLYWWKEFDTYKVGTVANSCSTMHKIHEKEFIMDDFSHGELIGEGKTVTQPEESPWYVMCLTIKCLNHYRDLYNQSKEKLKRGDLTKSERKRISAQAKHFWYQMIQLLPTSYNQKRTIMLNYEVLANMYKSRKNHKLDEWHGFCHWVEELPYSELITGSSSSEKLSDTSGVKEVTEG